ncbi:MAG: hypothetical protein ACE5R6_21005 [Candidatus Heimdallarchaeota archaeon]
MSVVSVAVVVSLLSGVIMLVAIIYMLTYIVRSFSSKSGILPTNFVLGSLFYFFGSTIFLFIGSEWLSELARVPMDGMPFFLNIGAASLMLCVILHIFCGFLVSLIYLRDKYRARKFISK